MKKRYRRHTRPASPAAGSGGADVGPETASPETAAVGRTAGDGPPVGKKRRFYYPQEELARERFFVVGVQLGRALPTAAELSLRELAQLVESANAEVIETELVRLSEIHPAAFFSRGKAEQLRARIAELEPDGVAVDVELSPVQQRNLTQVWDVKVIDRTGMILDIFARRAHTKEGILQVELAQLKYTLPRLTGMGQVLSRLGGGIGTRGPGEKKLEVDRRRIRERIRTLEREIARISAYRQTQRRTRLTEHVPQVAIIGYTNAGKSTLLNALAPGAGVFVEDKLFATLDPTTRRVRLPSGRRAVFTDTVGFIHNLPAELVAAFRATLEEIVFADLLVHLVDASSPARVEHIFDTEQVLEKIGAAHIPRLLVWNKTDLLDDPAMTAWLLGRFPDSLVISAWRGDGLEELLLRVERLLQQSA
ncbi:MAG: hypothetical protein Kow0059_16870 [Candidatus Sumerlaeia bacterium]